MSLFGKDDELRQKAEGLLLEKKQLIAEKLAPHIEKANEQVKDFWENEEEMGRVFGIVYDSLPLPIRLLCQREVFIDFCVSRSEDIRYVYEVIKNNSP